MTGLGRLVLYAVLIGDAVKDVAAADGLHGGVAAAVLRPVGEGHAVVGQHGVDPAREDLDHRAEERGAIGLGVGAEGQPSAAAELDDDCLLGLGQAGAAGL